jgi:hypothetical protein
MQIGSGSLAATFGSLALDPSRTGGVAQRSNAARADVTTAPQQRATTEFQQGVTHARAVVAPQKAQAAPATPNPNLPRGSLIDLKV